MGIVANLNENSTATLRVPFLQQEKLTPTAVVVSDGCLIVGA